MDNATNGLLLKDLKKGNVYACRISGRRVLCTQGVASTMEYHAYNLVLGVTQSVGVVDYQLSELMPPPPKPFRPGQPDPNA